MSACLTAICFASLVGCGGGSSSDPAPVTPVADSPIVAFSAPLPSASLASTSPVTVDARVTLANGLTASDVSLYRNGEWVASDQEAPYSWTLTDLPAGIQTLTVRATDSLGKMGEASRLLSVVDTSVANSQVVWAVNAGGQAFTSVDGIHYLADEGFTEGATRQIAAEIKATHNPVLYKSERWGESFAYAKELPEGSYHLTLRFAESVVGASGSRKFSVNVEGENVLNELDVRAISGNVNTAYDVTIPNLAVIDGQINIEFQGVVEAAVVSALVVSKPHETPTNWTLFWSDEFDYTGAPDSTKWNYDIQTPGWTNNELQAYTDSADNLRVEDGLLIIEGRQQAGGYTSGRIHSRNKGDLLYGRVEVRAKLPTGAGTWPAIRMMPTDALGYGNGWPDSGEMDIMEHLGHDPGQVHGSTHNQAYHWVNGLQRKGVIRVEDATSEFHLYAVEWDEKKLDFFVDDVLYFTYVNDHRGWQSWPYDKPFHLVLNLAIGGHWGGAAGIDPTIWPAQMAVDYVRLYTR